MTKAVCGMHLIVCMCACMIFVNSVSSRKGNNLHQSTRSDRELLDSGEGKTRSKIIEPQSCEKATIQCQHDKTCREALIGLKAKCAVKVGRCNAKMRDLSICAEIMDKLAKSVFNSSQKCSCENSQSRCARIYKAVYKNPCFASVRFLRKKNMLPRIEAISVHIQPKPGFAIKTNDIIEKLFGFVAINDSQKMMQVVTSQPSLKSIERSEPPSDTENNAAHRSIIAQDQQSLSAQNPAQKFSTNKNALLFLAITTGVLVVVVVGFGSGLLIYFGLKRKAKQAMKTVTMT